MFEIELELGGDLSERLLANIKYLKGLEREKSYGNQIQASFMWSQTIVPRLTHRR